MMVTVDSGEQSKSARALDEHLFGKFDEFVSWLAFRRGELDPMVCALTIEDVFEVELDDSDLDSDLTDPTVVRAIVARAAGL